MVNKCRNLQESVKAGVLQTGEYKVTAGGQQFWATSWSDMLYAKDSFSAKHYIIHWCNQAGNNDHRQPIRWVPQGPYPPMLALQRPENKNNESTDLDNKRARGTRERCSLRSARGS